MIGVIFSPKVEVVTTNHSPYAASQLNAGYVGKVSNTHVQARVKQGRRNKGRKNAEIELRIDAGFRSGVSSGSGNRNASAEGDRFLLLSDLTHFMLSIYACVVIDIEPFLPERLSSALKSSPVSAWALLGSNRRPDRSSFTPECQNRRPGPKKTGLNQS
jgi:hypothetical protein